MCVILVEKFLFVEWGLSFYEFQIVGLFKRKSRAIRLFKGIEICKKLCFFQ